MAIAMIMAIMILSIELILRITDNNIQLANKIRQFNLKKKKLIFYLNK